MRLINTATLKQQEFFETQLPKYAILSHTWGDDEVSLKRYTEDTLREGSGWKKILDFCRIARDAGLEWAWCDTCCIDNTSSAELSEAINSMHRWYKGSEVCLAFLEDFEAEAGSDFASVENFETGEGSDFASLEVSEAEAGSDTTLLEDVEAEADLNYTPLSNCRWFTRGWTLQELLAPHVLKFYDKRWSHFGNRDDLAVVLNRITGFLDRFYGETKLRIQLVWLNACSGRPGEVRLARRTWRIVCWASLTLTCPCSMVKEAAKRLLDYNAKS